MPANVNGRTARHKNVAAAGTPSAAARRGPRPRRRQQPSGRSQHAPRAASSQTRRSGPRCA
eukprot:799659-Lingulodinium_polyedra.AAC.1